MGLVTYSSDIDDNLRWSGFPFREGDLVVSARSKHGTTWMQMICLQLVLGSDRLPASLGEMAPWVDWRGEPMDVLIRRLAAQPHRRVLKTHTPLDGVPIDPRATYIVVCRHPLDAAVSLYHQGDNIDRARVAELMGDDPPGERPPRLPVDEWLREWTVDDSSAAAWLESPRGVLHHVADAWERSVLRVHYTDLVADPHTEVRRIAEALGVAVDDEEVARVVTSTGFDAMRSRTDELTPDPGGTFKDPGAFFRAGPASRGRDLLTPDEQAAFDARCRALAPPPVVDWLLR